MRSQLKSVIIDWEAFQVMRNQAFRAIPNEIGGLLLGKPCLNLEGEYLVWVSLAVEGICTSKRAEVIIEDKTYEKAWETMDSYERRGEILVVVGYYHSHTGFGVFLSRDDQEVMVANWQKLYNIAVVLDPMRKQWGVFGYSVSQDEGRIVRIPYSFFQGSHKDYGLGRVDVDLDLRSNNLNWLLRR